MSVDNPIGCILSRWAGEKRAFFPEPFIGKAHFYGLKSPATDRSDGVM
jgi:hypothetical protein